MASEFSTTAFAPTYSEERSRFCFNYKLVTSEQSRTDAIRYSPLVSLAVKHAIDNPTPQPSNGLSTLSKSTVSAELPSSGSPSAAPIAQKSQSAPVSKSSPHSVHATIFGKPSMLATTSKLGLPTPTPNVFGASSLTTTGAFGQAASPQHKRQISVHSGDAPFEGDAKVVKLEVQRSSTQASPASGGTSNHTAAVGKENVKPSTSTSSMQPQAAIFSAGMPGTSTPTSGTTKINSPSPFDFVFKPFGGNEYKEVAEQASSSGGSFGTLEKFARPIKPMKKSPALPQYGLLGFDLDNCDTNGNPEPILLNTNSPSSVFLCGSQGSGKSYTLSCMLENHLLIDPSVGVQRHTIPGFVFHWDTNASGSLAEAASLCSRGIKVHVLVSWSNYRHIKSLYEEFAREAGGTIEVRPLLFQDHELTVNNIRDLMAFRDASSNSPLYLEVIQNMLRRLGRQNERFSIATFLSDLAAPGLLNTGQLQMLEQRLNILKTFSAATAPEILQQDNKSLTGKKLAKECKAQGLDFTGDCITVERGTLTIVDLSDPFVDAGTACVLFDICLGIIIKTHKEALTAKRISPGLIITLDEAHKFLDKDIPSAEIFTNSLLTTIREQRHNAARVIIATQEPTISEKLMDLCSVSIVHRFSSPAWFTALCGHLGGASNLTSENEDDKTAAKKESCSSRSWRSRQESLSSFRRRVGSAAALVLWSLRGWAAECCG